MLQIEVKGIKSMMDKLKKHKLLIEGNITATKKRLVTDVFTDLVKGSPQWSGNLASNWYIEFHGIKGAYSPIDTYNPKAWGKKYQVGMNPAVGDTLNRELPKVSGIRWNTKIAIVNYTPYGLEVESGTSSTGGSIRPENYKNGQIAMVGYVTTKYSVLRNLKRRV